ncbi:pikachurin-like [Penaeus indicus]|uniref:pikachurin-like n=1 Tax=Penaeus indicus TaxID=29960 RepID=UPI00300CE9A4
MCALWWLTRLWAAAAVLTAALSSTPTKDNKEKLPFEAVFQGLCDNSELCEQLCFNLHDGTFECDCQQGYTLEPDGYSCTKLNYSKPDSSVLYEKEASFVAVLDDDYQSDSPGDYQHDDYQRDDYQRDDYQRLDYTRDDKYSDYRRDDYQRDLSRLEDAEDQPHTAELLEDPSRRKGSSQLIDRADILNYDRYKTEHESSQEDLGAEEETGPETFLELDTLDLIQPFTSPGPNLEQKVPSELPNLQATESLTPLCEMDCGKGHCHVDTQAGISRCMCPLGHAGRYCHPGPQIETARFHGSSWVAFAPLREAYRDVQLTLEFKPESPDGVLLVSGENDDLSGDFMAAVLLNGYVEFRWDCGSGAGSVRSPEGVHMGEWNRLTVYRHRWDVWLQLNDGHHIQGRSEGLFSRITFREPLYVGGSNNLTSLAVRLGVTTGLQGCVRRLQINDHVYRFHKNDALREPNPSSDYAALDGFDISECIGDACSEVECQHGGKCVASVQDTRNNSSLAATPPPAFFPPPPAAPICLCPLGYAGDFCEKQLNLEVPSFNGSAHLVFPALGGSVLSWLELELVFRAASTEGIMLYEGHRSDGSSDFIAVTLSQAHVLFTIDLGSGMLTLRSAYPIRPGVWHSVRVSRTGRWAWLYVDDQPVVSGLTPGGFTMLSLSHPLYLGGIPPTSVSQPILPASQAFVGCIQKLSLNGRPIHLVSGAVSGSNVGSCDHPCSERPCDNGGVCEPHGPTYTCRCPLGFKDEHCRSRVVTQVLTPSFSGRSFLKYSDPEIMKRVSGDKLHLWLRFRSLTPNGLLVWAGEEEDDGETDILIPPIGDSLSLELQDGRVVLRYNLGSGYARLMYNNSGPLDDGQWHTVRISRYEREAHVSVDGEDQIVVVSPGDLVQLNVDSSLYVGGRETFRGAHSGYMTPGLTGCIADLTLATDYHVDLITQAAAGQNIDYC